MSNNTYEAVIDEPEAKSIPIKAGQARAVPLILKLIRLGFRLGGTLSPQLAGRIAYKLWLTPTRFSTPESERAALESAEIAHCNINANRIATYSWGHSGPTVLLVHGWSGRGTQLGAFVEPLVEAGFRVLSFDAPAHGSSSGKQTTLYEITGVLLALNNQFGPFESVITHSFGGPCLAVAMQRGLKTSSVVSLSPPARVAALVEKFTDTLAIPEKAGNDFVRRFKDAFGEKVMQQASMDNNVTGLQIPALVIHDEDDADVPWQQGQAVARAWDNARFIKTSGLGHRRILRDASTIKLAVEFVKQQSSKALNLAT